jgi:hypothetical protein
MDMWVVNTYIMAIYKWVGRQLEVYTKWVGGQVNKCVMVGGCSFGLRLEGN